MGNHPGWLLRTESKVSKFIKCATSITMCSIFRLELSRLFFFSLVVCLGFRDSLQKLNCIEIALIFPKNPILVIPLFVHTYISVCNIHCSENYSLKIRNNLNYDAPLSACFQQNESLMHWLLPRLLFYISATTFNIHEAARQNASNSSLALPPTTTTMMI